MKKKIVLCLVMLMGIGVGSLLTACGSKSNQVQASEPGYLTYCGSQSVCGDKRVEVYEDKVHHKVVYIATDGFQHPISIATAISN